MKRFFALILALLLACGSLSACGKKAGKALRVDMAGSVSTLDPQLAAGDTAVTAIANCFEGLVRQTAEGGIAPAGAERWSVSADGRTYTFQLRADALWSDGVPVKAADYRFAFERIFNYEYLSPYAQSFASIAGAQERIALSRALAAYEAAQAAAAVPAAQAAAAVPAAEAQSAVPPAEPAEGENALPSAAAPTAEEITAMVAALPPLGVRVSGDDTLIITLETRNSSFLQRLTATAAVPCREDYFTETRARYGRDAGHLLCNGSFKVSEWTQEELRLTPNARHYAYAETMPASVRLLLGQSDPTARFLAGSTDFCALTYSQQAAAEKAGFTLVSQGAQLWAVVFNERKQPTANAGIRRALAACPDLPAYAEAGRIPQRYAAASSFLLDEDAAQPAYDADRQAQKTLCSPAGAKAAYAEARADAETAQSLSALAFILPESAELDDLAGYLQRAWLDTLNLYVNVYTLPDAEYSERLLSGDYDLAFQLLSAPSDGVAGTLAAFRSDSAANCCGYASAAFDAALDAAGDSADADSAAQDYARAAALLRADSAALPVLTQSSYCALGKGVSGITMLPDGTLLFCNAKKK